MKIVECVPNFSEGRRQEVIEAIANAAGAVEGVTILDCESDLNHNRMVLTFVGEPEAVKRAALAASDVAIQEIDLTKHTGEHPRMGAVDVVPFVPLKGVSIEDCIALANEFGAEFSNKFKVPVFLYEAAARKPERQDLAQVRRGQFEGLRELIGVDAKRDPDYGPRKIHPTAGATAVGARPILIAYNINLGTTDISIAKKIAHRVRARDGGLPAVKALGFELKDKHMVQVSMNLTDYNTTSISRAFDEVLRNSEDLGVKVVESEIVGLVPLEAISQAATSYLRLANFTNNQIIENRLLQISLEPAIAKSENKGVDFGNLSVSDFIDSVASSNPTPGGGTVSAYTGALGAALVSMVCRLTIDKKGYEMHRERVGQILQASESLVRELKYLANRDSEAFSRVTRSFGLPKTSEEERRKRADEIQSALKVSTEIPAETMRACYQVFTQAKEMTSLGNKSARSDAETAMEISFAAIRGAWSNVKTNFTNIKDEEFKQKLKADLRDPLLLIDPAPNNQNVPE